MSTGGDSPSAIDGTGLTILSPAPDDMACRFSVEDRRRTMRGTAFY